jgi:hypothetical protein
MSNEALRAYAVGTSVFLRGLLDLQGPRMEQPLPLRHANAGGGRK